LKSKDQGHWKRRCKNRISRLSSSKVGRFTSKQEQNDQQREKKSILTLKQANFGANGVIFIQFT